MSTSVRHSIDEQQPSPTGTKNTEIKGVPRPRRRFVHNNFTI